MSNLYYVYYDNKSKNIISVTNEKDDNYETGIVVEFDDIENFLTGKWHFKDFKVDYESASSELKIVAIADQGFNFDSNEFRVISENTDYAEFIIEWNSVTKSWTFSLDEAYKKTFNGVFNSMLLFFVTLESDLDFLIRTISVDTDNLKHNKITVPFETDIENDINKISISSKMNFKNYTLRVVHE